MFAVEMATCMHTCTYMYGTCTVLVSTLRMVFSGNLSAEIYTVVHNNKQLQNRDDSIVLRNIVEASHFLVCMHIEWEM